MIPWYYSIMIVCVCLVTFSTEWSRIVRGLALPHLIFITALIGYLEGCLIFLLIKPLMSSQLSWILCTLVIQFSTKMQVISSDSFTYLLICTGQLLQYQQILFINYIIYLLVPLLIEILVIRQRNCVNLTKITYFPRILQWINLKIR